MLTKRTFIQGVATASAAVPVAALAAPALAATHKKPYIVMVHGSWHWGGCFQKVANKLGLMGYPVSTPDLASHGYNSDVAWDKVGTMENYTVPARALIEAADEPVVLLGHSMGGVSLTYLAENLPEKIRTLIYLCAFMTPVGKSAQDYIDAFYANDPAAASLAAITALEKDGLGVSLDWFSTV